MALENSAITVKAANDWQWIRNHLILLAAVALFVFGAVRFTDGMLEKRAITEAARWQGILETQRQVTSDLQKQNADHEETWQKENAAQTSLIASLTRTISARTQTTQATLQKDAKLDTKSAAEKLSSQISLPVSANPDDSVSMGLDAARLVVQKLDLLPSVQADLSDTQQKVSAQENVIANLTESVSEQKEIVVSVQTELKTQIEADKKELAAAKAVARKSKLRWFAAGFVTGVFAKRIFLGVF